MFVVNVSKYDSLASSPASSCASLASSPPSSAGALQQKSKNEILKNGWYNKINWSKFIFYVNFILWMIDFCKLILNYDSLASAPSSFESSAALSTSVESAGTGASFGSSLDNKL